MTKAKKATALLLAILTLSLSLISCSRSNKIEYTTDDKFVDKKTGISYKMLTSAIYPISVTEEKYAVMDEIQLYKIEGAQPEKILSDSTGMYVFYSDDMDCPTLGNMSISETKILIDAETEVAVSAEDSARAVTAYTSGTSLERPMTGVDISVSVAFYDRTLGLYCMLTYMELKEDFILDGQNMGKRFLFDRYEGRCVAVDALFDTYLEEYREAL